MAIQHSEDWNTNPPNLASQHSEDWNTNPPDLPIQHSEDWNEITQDYVFISGEALKVGAHGNHELIYISGDEGTDTGDSSYVFERGTGVDTGN